MADVTAYRAEGPFDWDALLALIQRAFAGMAGRIDPPSSLTRLTAAGIAAHPGEVWAIGGPVEACVMLTVQGDVLYLGKLAVAPDKQRRGHARALIGVAESRARALGLTALELQTRVELVENHAAFRTLGFAEAARTRHAGFDRDTAVTFRKPV